MSNSLKCLESRVLEIERFDQDGKTRYLIIRTEKPAAFNYKAGQFAMLAHPKLEDKSNPGELFYRAYSIASAPHLPFLEFAIAVSRTGGLTEYFSENLAPGDTLCINGPHGIFLHRSKKERIVFVATGAGIAPAISMVRDLIFKKSKKKIQFFYGFHCCSMFLFKEELIGYMRENDNFSMFTSAFDGGPCCWEGACGYIQPVFEKVGYRGSNTHYYVCGSPRSMEATFEVLSKMNVPIEKIFHEAGGK